MSTGARCLCVWVGLSMSGCLVDDELRSPVRDRMVQADIDTGTMEIAELIQIGRGLYIFNFSLEDGFGNGRDGATPPNFSRLIGPDATSCNSCHGQNNVIAGWGTNAANLLVELDDPINPTVAGSNERNTLHEHGVAWLELLSKEMSLELRAIREEAVAAAAAKGDTVVRNLVANGADFGTIAANPDGSVDTSGVEGCDVDLRIRPLHHKGHESSVRIFSRNALARHPGIQSSDALLMMNPDNDPLIWDEDEDGVIDEYNEGELTALTSYQIGLPAPVETNTGDPKVEAGRALMTALGCVECHHPVSVVNEPIWRYTSSNSITIEIDLTDSSLGTPRLVADDQGRVSFESWGDLKRHDIGPESHEPLDQPVDHTLPNWDGGRPGDQIEETLPSIPRELMMTTELWGVGDTGPWWHDGSSPTIADAILRHGGEAREARDLFDTTTIEEQQQVLAFLNQLRVGVVGEILVAGKSEVKVENLPLNSVTEYWRED